MQLRPSNIRFTQDSIGCRFTDGKRLTDTFRELLYGLITPDDIENIEVVQYDGVWWALTGNRRLYLYQRLQDLGVVEYISVRVRFLSEPWVQKQWNNRLTTDCEGLDAVCRQPEADKIISKMIKKWRKDTKTRKVNKHSDRQSIEHGYNNHGFPDPQNETMAKVHRTSIPPSEITVEIPGPSVVGHETVVTRQPKNADDYYSPTVVSLPEEQTSTSSEDSCWKWCLRE